jgi:predicted  nucleic acid-binding Zn-ribbon protein
MKRPSNDCRQGIVERMVAAALLVTLAAACCNRSAVNNGELADAKREWSRRLSTLQAQRQALDGQIAAARERVGAGRSIAAQATQLRLQVAAAGQAQATLDLNGEVEAVAHEVETAKDPGEALMEARLRMAQEFAAQEENIRQTQVELSSMGRAAEHENENVGEAAHALAVGGSK